MILYLKNYKGFEEALIPIQDINFFVGDNSTGKTSIISLLKILDDYEFWNSSSFKDIDNFGKEIDTGYFSNILNKNSKEKTFSIGICCNQENAKYFDAINIVFSEQDDLPVISELKYLKSGKNIYVKIHNNEFEYSVNNTEQKPSENIDFFKNWLNKKINAKIKVIKTKKRIYSITKIINFVDKDIFNYQKKIRIENVFFRLINEPPVRSNIDIKYIKDELEKLRLILKQKERKNILISFGKNACMFDNISITYVSENKHPVQIVFKGIGLSINSVGFGVSQILLSLVNILSFENTHYTLQQPEVHLHPKAHSEFGEFIFNSASKSNNKFVIETHSDFLIDRFRYCLHKKFINETKVDFNSQIVFFEKLENGDNTVKIIDILESGKYKSSKELRRFRKFFINEVANNWEI